MCPDLLCTIYLYKYIKISICHITLQRADLRFSNSWSGLSWKAPPPTPGLQMGNMVRVHRSVVVWSVVSPSLCLLNPCDSGMVNAGCCMRRQQCYADVTLSRQMRGLHNFNSVHLNSPDCFRVPDFELQTLYNGSIPLMIQCKAMLLKLPAPGHVS